MHWNQMIWTAANNGATANLTAMGEAETAFMNMVSKAADGLMKQKPIGVKELH